MKLSIVATLYRSAPYIASFHMQASAAARRLAQDDYEIVLVNDGSPDDSLPIAIALTATDRHTVLVDLSRNFGHHKAMMTGLAHALGDLVFLIDSDLEEDVAWLDVFAPLLRDRACDVVFGVQASRKGGWFERWSGAAYYRLMRSVSDVDLPPSMVTARLMTRRYVDALLEHREHETDIGGLWAITGFRQHAVTVDKRSSSPSTYTLRRRFAVLVNALTAFSSAPLTIIFVAGAALSALAAVALVVVVLHSATTDAPVGGWASLLASVWLVGSLIVMCIGVVGIYLAKVLVEVKQRPYTIVRQVHGRDDG